MKILILLSIFITTITSFILPVHEDKKTTYGSFADITFDSSEYYYDTSPDGYFQYRYIDLTFIIDISLSECEEPISIKLVSGQSGLSNEFNPSNLMFNIQTYWEAGCTVAAPNEIVIGKFKQREFLDFRETSTEPWEPYIPLGYETRRYTFTSGYCGGFKIFGLTPTLNFENPEAVYFDDNQVVTFYSVVEGKLLEYGTDHPCNFN